MFPVFVRARFHCQLQELSRKERFLVDIKAKQVVEHLHLFLTARALFLIYGNRLQPFAADQLDLPLLVIARVP